MHCVIHADLYLSFLWAMVSTFTRFLANAHTLVKAFFFFFLFQLLPALADVSMVTVFALSALARLNQDASFTIINSGLGV